MLSRTRLKCPACQSTRCRKSKWRSLDEKLNHQNAHPYRCLDCSRRFFSLVVSRKSTKNVRFAIFIAGALSCILAVILAVIWVVEASDSSSSIAFTKTVEAKTAIPEQELRRAAEDGDPNAQFKLGSLLFHDLSRSTKNSAEAVKWLEMAAENGNTDAMIFLGRLSRTGVGILQNYSQASNWIQLAAEKGNPEGMLEMGRLCRDGVGVEKSLVMAYAWFNRAAAEHNLDAVNERDSIAKILTTEELKQAQQLSSELAKNHGKLGAVTVKNN